MNQALLYISGMLNWIAIAQFSSRAILGLLALLSIWSVSIMIDRRRALKAAAAGKTLDEWKSEVARASRIDGVQEDHLLAGLMRELAQISAPGESRAEALERAARSYLNSERAKLEKGLNSLATLGSNAPFIGLLGTVLGIIQAFGELARQSAGSQSVMAGISEALVATAVGLLVAIPAVISYNFFSRRVRELMNDCEVLKDFAISRMLLKGGS